MEIEHDCAVAHFMPPWPPTLLAAMADAVEAAGFKVRRQMRGDRVRAFSVFGRPTQETVRKIAEATDPLEAEYDENPARFRRARRQ